MAKHSHAQWSSQLTFILAATGSAVGLGNIWKFPYMTGQDGGAAFVLIYLACAFLVGAPLLIAEWILGRRGQSNPIQTMRKVATQEGRSRGWALFGASGVLGAFLILSFYSVIGGWSLAYTIKAASGSFHAVDAAGIEALFNDFLASPGRLLLWHTLFMAATIFIVARGIKAGVERAAQILMPGLIIVLLALVVYGLFSGHMGETLSFLFKPDWKAFRGHTVLDALGHAFFTLSLGMGIMLAYGSYLNREINLIATARTVIIFDTAIALLAGIAIFAIVFANDLDPSSGPGLVFVTLPLAFGQMGLGTLLGFLFFLLLALAALTSAISLTEPVVETLEEHTPLSRAAATWVGGIGIWALGIAALFSFNLWSDVLFWGHNLFDGLDKLTSLFFLPLTGLGLILFVGWRMQQASIMDELKLGSFGRKMWLVACRYIAPAGVIIVFISSLLGNG